MFQTRHYGSDKIDHINNKNKKEQYQTWQLEWNSLHLVKDFSHTTRWRILMGLAEFSFSIFALLCEH